MALISAILSLLSKQLGDFLKALFGWSVTGLFGQLPSKKQTAMSVALILAIVWPLLVIGCFKPGIAAWAVGFIPLHEWLGKEPLRILWIVLSVIVPAIVGAIISWAAPAHKQRGGILRTVIYGYPLTVGLFISFLLTFVLVPVLKVVALAKQWKDEHIYLQVKENSYRQVIAQLVAACDKAGIKVIEQPMPRAMRAPVKVLRWFARGAIDPIVASEPRKLSGDGIEVYLYPSDLLLRGIPERIQRIRAAVAREMMDAPAYLTQDPKAQAIEDELKKTWTTLGQESDSKDIRLTIESRVPDIARVLDEANVPFEDWMLLYNNVQRLELAAEDEPYLEEAPRKSAREEAGTMTEPTEHNDPRPNVSVVELIKEAVEEARALLKAEVALAKDEAQEQLTAIKQVSIAFLITIVLTSVALSMLFMALVLAIAPQPLTALITGGGLLVLAGVAGFVAYRKLPKKPMEKTQERLKTDVEILKDPEHGNTGTPPQLWTADKPAVAEGSSPTTSS